MPVPVIMVGWLDEEKGHYEPYLLRTLDALLRVEDVVIAGVFTHKAIARKIPAAYPSIRAFPLPDLPHCGNKLAGRLAYRIGLLLRLLFVARTAKANNLGGAIYIFLAVDLIAGAFLRWLFNRFSNIFVVHQISNLERRRGRLLYGPLKHLMSRSLSLAKWVVALEPPVYRLLREEFPEHAGRLTVIPDYRPRARARAGSRVRRFALLGSLAPERGVGLLLSAWKHAGPAIPDSHLLIAGSADPHYARRLRQEVTQLNRCGINNVTLTTNYIPTEAYNQILQETDCIVLPQLSELGTRSSGVLLDALAAGKIVVVPDDSARLRLRQEGEPVVGFRRGDSLDLARVLASLGKGRIKTSTQAKVPNIEETIKGWTAILHPGVGAEPGRK